MGWRGEFDRRAKILTRRLDPLDPLELDLPPPSPRAGALAEAAGAASKATGGGKRRSESAPDGDATALAVLHSFAAGVVGDEGEGAEEAPAAAALAGIRADVGVLRGVGTDLACE